MRLAVEDWWEMWRRRPDGQAIVLERIAAASPYTADLHWLRSLDGRHNLPRLMQEAVTRVLRDWSTYDQEAGPEHRRMTREHGARSIDDIED